MDREPVVVICCEFLAESVSAPAPPEHGRSGQGGSVSGAGDSGREVESLRERMSLFRDAAVRINESLELDAVLQGVLDSARELAGARYGLIALVAEDQVLTDCLTSGLTPEQSEGFLHQMPHRFEFFNLLFGIEERLRLDDFQGFLKESGLPEFRPPFPASDAMAYLAVPIRHRDQRTGSIYLTEKEGGFTAEDEETLAMFASLAALVISNALRYRGEQRARADLEGLVNTAPMIVLVFQAATGAVTSMNRDARRLIRDLGLRIKSIQELIGAGTYQLADGRMLSQGESSLLEMLQSGEAVRDEEMIAEFPDGTRLVLMVNATPIRSVDGNVESVVLAAQDLTPQAEAERLRTEFLGMIGHELRSPLAAIKGSATTLLQSESSLDPAEMVQFFRIIDEQSDYMRDLLSDLIDVVRIETGTLPVTPAPTEMARLVEEARNTFMGAGGRENIHIDLPFDLPPVMADRRRIVQVVSNLLANASRNSHDGSAIRVEAARDGVHVSVSVVDNGRGVTAERLPHLFVKFSRSDGSNQARDLGLGLAICKGIVEAHGGRIWAESDGPGLGSRFTFTVPVSDTAPPGAAARRVGALGWRADGEPIRVLVVDDDPRTLKRVRDSLADEGYEPTVTGDPEQVARLIEEVDPHVVLLDLMLPGTDGIELMQDILTVRDTPIIFLSAYSRDDLVAQAFEMGAADYIIKPSSPTELAARVKAAARNKLARRGRPGPAHRTVGRFALGDLAINYDARMVTVAGSPVNLTRIEFNLLAELSANAGIPQTREQLLRKVWGPDKADDAQRLRTIIKNLRRKLGDSATNPKYIVTVPHFGYRIDKP